VSGTEKKSLIKPHLVLEYLENSITCRDFIMNIWNDRQVPGNDAILRTLAAEIGKSISILHKNNIIHGDLTTSNILIEST
jgi:TP53 regulating kinase and related kinases